MTNQLISLVCALTVAAAAAEGTSGPAEKSELRKLLDAPASLGVTTAQLTKAFGKPVDIKEVASENDSKVYTYQFKGAEAKVLYAPNFGNKRSLIRLKVTQNFPALKLALPIGAPALRAIVLFGQPVKNKRGKMEFVYQLPESGSDGDRLLLTTTNDIVTGIEWAPYLD